MMKWQILDTNQVYSGDGNNNDQLPLKTFITKPPYFLLLANSGELQILQKV